MRRTPVLSIMTVRDRLEFIFSTVVLVRCFQKEYLLVYKLTKVGPANQRFKHVYEAHLKCVDDSPSSFHNDED
jgi:hypothetical protein